MDGTLWHTYTYTRLYSIEDVYFVFRRLLERMKRTIIGNTKKKENHKLFWCCFNPLASMFLSSFIYDTHIINHSDKVMTQMQAKWGDVLDTRNNTRCAHHIHWAHWNLCRSMTRHELLFLWTHSILFDPSVFSPSFISDFYVLPIKDSKRITTLFPRGQNKENFEKTCYFERQKNLLSSYPVCIALKKQCAQHCRRKLNQKSRLLK